MAKQYNPVVALRVPQKMVDRMDAAISTGLYRNRADYIMAALRQFDDGLDSRGAPGGGGGTPPEGPAGRG